MSPIYEEEGRVSQEDLKELRRKNRCSVCGERLDVFLDFDNHLAFLACSDWRRTGHDGIEREPSRYEKGGLAEFTIERRREIMEQSYGEEKTKALSRYTGGGVVMTKSVATEIVETLWGPAPAIEKTKCILLCQTYQLNPLMKHLYLVGYRRKVNGQFVKDGQGKDVLDWSIQQGIGATRLLAQRKHSYSYLDMTPRKATKAEIEKILGDTADPNCVYGFVWIKDTVTGAEAFGLRGIEKNASIKGTEKGNTHLNMACIRAERLALDRQYPGEMPPNIEVVDEKYMEIEVPDVGKVNTSTGEIIEGESRELSDDKPEQNDLGVCPIHNVPLVRGKGNFPPYCPNKVEGTGRSAGKKVWCKGKALSAAVAEQPEEPGIFTEETDRQEPGLEMASFIDLDWLKESLTQLQALKLDKWTNKEVLARLNIVTGGQAKSVSEAAKLLNKETAALFAKEIQDLLDMA